MNPDAAGNAGLPREGLTREYQRDKYKELGDDKNYDINKGVTYLVNLNQSSSEEESTNTLAHELSVHVDQNAQRVQNMEDRVIDGTLKPGSKEYVQQLVNIKTSASVDHDNLGQGKIKSYQNISAQLDQLKNTKQYTKLYNEDVNSNK